MALVRDAAYRCDERGYNTLPLADNTIVYRHAALGLSAGRVRPIQSGDRFAGFVARRNQDSRGLAAGAPPVQVPIISSGTIEIPIAGVAATDVGATVYATDDNTFGLTGLVAIGTISGIASAGVARVAFNALGPSSVSGDGIPVPVASSRALTAADNGMVLECTATVTLTVPAGLPNGFACAVIPSGTTSIASSGGALLNGATSTLTRAAATNAMFAIQERASATDSFVVSGV